MVSFFCLLLATAQFIEHPPLLLASGAPSASPTTTDHVAEHPHPHYARPLALPVHHGSAYHCRSEGPSKQGQGSRAQEGAPPCDHEAGKGEEARRGGTEGEEAASQKDSFYGKRERREARCRKDGGSLRQGRGRDAFDWIWAYQ